MDAAKAAAMHFLKYHLSWSSIAMIWYDYFLTFQMEVQYMWGQKFRLSTTLYIWCRYALIGNPLYVWAHLDKGGNACDAWYQAVSTMAQFGRAAVIFTYIGRVYALTSGNKCVLAYLSALGLTVIILGIVHVPGIQCIGGSKHPIVNSLLDTFMCAFEFSAAIVTFVRCVQTRQVLKSSVHKRDMLTLLIDQGALYFVFTSLFTVAWITLNYRAPPGSFLQRCLNGFVIPLSCILTARFLLHLRAYEAQTQALAGPRRPQASPSLPSSSSSSSTFDGDLEFRHSHSDFRSTVYSAITSDFGEDPVRTAERVETTSNGPTIM